ncbi:adhesion G-protein coupled receptor F3 [Poeciliopsis prolifica]|uniref:adhesion G-protein coupled receptor F3 n=1 Tax=Poeciliopsis prolifica TaxID=188132 RepID=UPI002413A8F0|nr:adhesion G-protein coupled receptor F3 [Poeciliopsis prolifica]XP_054894132.1 adhesion G-protein coupled receptor F3 [Poeciliopsis prolifica]
MWVFIFLCILGLNSQASATVSENSTQMYYAKLTIDRSAVERIISMLNFSVNDNKVNIKEVTMTTECLQNGNGNKTCTCKPGHKWSDDVRLQGVDCNEKSCTLRDDSNTLCTLNTTVGITGRFKLEGTNFSNCLTDKSSDPYKECHKDLLKKMKSEYSKIRGFDSLTILQFSVGSIIVDFAMKIVSDVNSTKLFEKSTNLTNTLIGSMTLETKGIVNLEISKESVLYDNSTVVICRTEKKLNAQPEWTLKREDGEFLITNGSISTVEIKPKESTVTVQKVNELWQGEYICLFVEKENQITINHKANATLDVCLKPKIEISADPAFPLCKTDGSVFLVIVKCEIKSTSEKYNVSWQEGAIRRPTIEENNKQIYSAQKLVDCKKGQGDSSASPDVFCEFTNQCHQTKAASMRVEVIYLEDKYCPAEGEWGNTKAGFTAEIKCADKAGTRKRKCSPRKESRVGIWGDEVSECVERDLASVLENAAISDIGLGILATNAAIVFERFANVTKTSKLPGYANINTSVEVLSTMDEKLQNLSSITNESAIENFLFSSSHLLNKSLEDSWTKSPENSSMAERFMISVESLIKRSNMTSTMKENLQVYVCNSSECKIKVFNVTVSLPDGVNVKTAAFRQLDKYLPNLDNKSEINSIIVSTTADNHRGITLDFDLFNQRPRNVELKCVFWDTNKHEFSSEGCKWGGPSNEGRCICDHLSSFALLLSKEPLEVPGITYVTYAALSVSVLSLIVTLVIELIVWSDVVKTNTLYLRHTAHVNICLCLLIGNLCFLASSSNPENMSDLWCRTSAVLKHFCYLAMFFWTFCLSTTLLHQAVFLFHKVSKANYLRFSLIVGYAVPFIIVFVTFLTCNGGAEGVYYTKETCWLVYGGVFKGTFFTFIIPVGTIVFINVFAMLVVIMKLISHHSEIQQKTDISPEKEKAAAKTVVRSIILLTPIFGVTWIFGFAILMFDLTSGPAAFAFEYIFTILNGFQGFFILLTTCFGDRMTREALLKHIKKKKAPASSVSESTSKTESTWKK